MNVLYFAGGVAVGVLFSGTLLFFIWLLEEQRGE